jgi:NADH-quinone oxidoreductase subunit L
MLSLGWFSRLLTNKYYMDDLYTNDVVRPIQYPIANMVNNFDRGVIDGAVNGVGHETQLAGRFLRYVQSGDVQRYAVYLFVGVAVLAVVISRLGG